MNVKISINCENAAFGTDASRESDATYEVTRILRKLAEKMDDGALLADFDTLPLMDLNGNRVGLVTVDE